MSKRVCLTVFLSVSVALFAAAPVEAATVVPTPAGVALTINNFQGEDHTDPHVSGDIVAYTTASTTSSIHYHNLMTGADSTIPNGGAFDFLSDVDNGRVVFSRSVPGTNGAIFLFDTSTPSAAPQVLSPLLGSARDSVSIGGNTVAWQDRSAFPNAQLVVYDLVNGTTTTLTNDGSTMQNLSPDVSPDGGVIAWVKCNPSGLACQVWDATRDALGAWTSRQLTFGTLSASHPGTNGLIVVYAVGDAGTTGATHYQPVGGGAEQTISVPLAGATEVNPSISGDLVAFDLFTTVGTSSIWVADLTAGTLYQVSPVQPQAPTLTDVSLAANGIVNVVWQVFENGQFDAYGFRYMRKVTPMITTLATATASAGGTITDTATFSGGNAPTGTITFNLVGPITAPCLGPAVFTSIKPVNGNGSYTSDPFTPVSLGTYQWFTAYSGDNNNNLTTTACKAPDETSTVTKAGPTLTTTATSSANTIGSISDTATISGGGAPTGTIVFKLFGPNNAACSGTPSFSSTKSVNGNGSYTSDPDPFTPLHPGTYGWVASYGGDANNNAVSTACNDPGETSGVTQASPSDLSAVVGQMLSAGCIDNAGIANALSAKLAAAQSAVAASSMKTAVNVLGAFIDQVRAQSAKHVLASCAISGLTIDPAGVLTADARSILDSLALEATPNPITGSVVTASGPGVSGATLSVVDAVSGKTLATAMTDVTGFYFFPTTGLLSNGGTYWVSVTGLPSWFTSSSPAQTFTWAGSAISFTAFAVS